MDAKTEFVMKWVLKVLMGGWLIYFVVAIFLSFMKKTIKTFIEMPPSLVVAIVWTLLLVLIGSIVGYVLDMKKQEPPTQNYMS